VHHLCNNCKQLVSEVLCNSRVCCCCWPSIATRRCAPPPPLCCWNGQGAESGAASRRTGFHCERIQLHAPAHMPATPPVPAICPRLPPPHIFQ
jgi:hypothetical protein